MTFKSDKTDFVPPENVSFNDKLNYQFNVFIHFINIFICLLWNNTLKVTNLYYTNFYVKIENI